MDEGHNEPVPVIIVSKRDAKRAKTFLEARKWLHRDYRMTLVSDDRIAIPITTIPPQILNGSESIPFEQAECRCPLSSAALGNNHRTNVTTSITQQAVCNVLKRNCSSSDIESILYEQLQQFADSVILPKSLELLGDDRTVVLTSKALNPNAYCWRILLESIDATNFWTDVWKELAALYQSHRVVRRGFIDPNSPVRHSTFQLLWHDGSYRSPGWITVTEQGIRQSFDLTKVMFSRGNISEKIRFGRLVQQDEVVLDLYAGIGYFTLPALVHGKAKHVTCCEWNSDAVEALKFNLKDNNVDSRSTVLEGDCRTQGTQLKQQFDRVSLGLLPSSEGGWKTAVHALRPIQGGWMHIHANVPANEVESWGSWMSLRLFEIAQERNDQNDWVVLLVHVEKVKSFAPTVNHYVADVTIGTKHTVSQRIGMSVNEHVMRLREGKVVGIVGSIVPPSCALSETGALHQAWMRESG